MRYLVFAAVLAIACNAQKKQSETIVVTDSTERQDGVDSTFCNVEFRDFLKDSLEYIKPPLRGGFVLLKRNDRIIKKIRTKYLECLIGKTGREIFDLFGLSIQINQEIAYSTVQNESENLTPKMMMLIFEFDEQMKVSGISYREKGYGIEGDGEPSILDEEKKVICDVEFRVFLKDSLQYIKPPKEGGNVLLKRDDSLFNAIGTKYRKCIIGKSLSEIIELFGNSGTIHGEIRYSCVNSEPELFTHKLMMLIFEYDEQLIIREVFYRPRGIGIEGDGEPSILDEENKEKKKKKNDD